jgi:redox-sensitive bicupin YhaK (pirin superfamily)
MPNHPVLGTRPLGFVWDTPDPFLFCVHHDDAYPAGNGSLGPAAALTGRDLGQDFAGLDGWRMYHGRQIPGFPRHPHRGFETITLVRQGLIDHADSLGAAGRFGGGDCQWMTAGGGVEHSEMFPLVHQDQDNPLELFQIWLNLPAASKRVPAHYKMLWREELPVVRQDGVEAVIVAGRLGDALAPTPPPDSWASRPEADVAIWTLKLGPNASFTLPRAQPGSNRWLYFFGGEWLEVAGQPVPTRSAAILDSGVPVRIDAGPTGAECLMLQGRPIGEPIARQGPFVMNTRQELEQAYADYRAGRFGTWPHDRTDPTHGHTEGRFALHSDGTRELPKT